MYASSAWIFFPMVIYETTEYTIKKYLVYTEHVHVKNLI